MIANEISMVSAITTAINEEAERLRGDAIRAAVEDYEKTLRAKVAETAMRVASFYDVERNGARLIITVRLGDSQ